MDVVLLLQDLTFGGTQRYAIHLLKHMDRERFAPRLWVLRGGMDMAPLARETGAPVTWLSRDAWVTPRALAALARKIRNEKPAILYTLTVVPNIWGRIFGRIARVPVIVSSWRNPQPRQFEGLLWRMSTRIISNSAVLKEELVADHGVHPGRVAVVRNGVDPDYFAPDPGMKDPEPRILSAGRLVARKDPLTLLKGFRSLLEHRPTARLDMVGDGPLKGRLTAYVREKGLASRVSLIPGQRDLRPYLKKAWVFVMTPTREASPNAVLEAMASALPVVATRVGGIPELVQDGETGVLIDPRSPESLCRVLLCLLNHPRELEAMGRKSRDRVVSHHTVERMVAQTEHVIMEALDRAHSRRVF